MTSVDIAEVPVDTADAAEPAETAEAAETAAETTDTTEAAVDTEPAAASAEPPTPAPKRRGRPVGSKNRVKEPPPPPEPKAKPKPKAKTRVIVAPVDDEPAEPLPQYVQRDLPPQQPQDLAAALLGLMQTHERERMGRKRAQYASWVSRF